VVCGVIDADGQGWQATVDEALRPEQRIRFCALDVHLEKVGPLTRQRVIEGDAGNEHVPIV
jgi:hypothetical protein